MRNRQVEMQAIIRHIGKNKYTDAQGLTMLAKELIKVGDILRGYEEKLNG